jgi:hypothetical protein
VIEGKTEGLVRTKSGLSAYAGLAPDLFAGDAAALGAFRNALFKENKFDPEAFLSKKNFFARRHVSAIVLEVPTAMIGKGKIASGQRLRSMGTRLRYRCHAGACR